MRPPSLSIEQTKELQNLFYSGKSLKQLSEHFGVAQITVKNYLNKSVSQPEHKLKSQQEHIEKVGNLSVMDKLEPADAEKFEALARLYVDEVVKKEIERYHKEMTSKNFRLDPYS